MSYFDDFVLKPFELKQKIKEKSLIVPLNKLRNATNDITKGQMFTVAGRQTSGKTTFFDYNYFIGPMYNYFEMDPDDRPQIKNFYFSLKGNLGIKMQKWLCLLMKLDHKTLLDIPTLMKFPGAMYEIDDEDTENIHSCEDFFNNIEEITTFINKSQSPSIIYNRIKDYMLTVGKINDNKEFELNESNSNLIVNIYIDDLESLKTELEGNVKMTELQIQKLMSDYFRELKSLYKVNIFGIKPVKYTGFIRTKDSQPSYRDLGLYYDVTDIGVVTYNPYNENNNNYLNFPVQDFVINRKNRLRTCTIVRNTAGIENATFGLIFLGECGYYTNAPDPTDAAAIEEIIHKLS